MSANKEPKKRYPASESLQALISRWKDGTFGEILDDWKWIFSYSARYKKEIIFYVIAGILSTSLSLVSAVIGKYLIDIITGFRFDRLWVLAVAMVGSALVSILLRSVLGRITAKIGLRIGNDIRGDIFDQIIDADWKSISRFTNGDILSRFSEDVGTVSGNAVSWLPTVLVALYNFAATFLLLLHYDVIMALLAFLGTPFVILISRTVVRLQREYGRKAREKSGELMAFEVETFHHFDTIKAFGVTERYSRRLRRKQDKYRDAVLEYNLFSVRTNAFLSMVAQGVSLVVFGYCLFRLWTNDITYGTMTLFISQHSALSTAFNGVLAIIPNFLNSSVSAHRIRELVELPKERHLPQSTELDGDIPAGLSVAMRGVSFAYAEGQPVLENIDFEARPGEIIAMVGPSGEGKTTMIRLLLGLIRPEHGRVEIAGASGKTVEANADTRHLFAYVPQGNTILSGTVAENLRMVREDATDAELTAALEAACAWEFVSRMDGGLNAPIGEQGKGLSEGQAQRVAIARAILRDAPILLLDEATSALDTETERRVLAGLIRAYPNKTVVLTTHRPSVLGLCRRVYRVTDTRLEELGEEAAAKLVMDY